MTENHRAQAPDFTPKCGHVDHKNREGEKFLCVVCHHTDHADTKASRTIATRAGLVFPPNNKTLPTDCGKVMPWKSSLPKCKESRNQAYEAISIQLDLSRLL